MDPTQRFSHKAQVYARYRMDFNPQVISAIREMTDLPASARVLDVGAGTGMFTRHLLGYFEQVYALEPNPAMRATAAAELADFPGFRAFAARAEEIPLAATSVDLITAGRVLHWLQPEPTRRAFQRIAKPGAWLIVARLQTLGEDYHQSLREIRTPENGFRTREHDPHPGDVPVEYYYSGGQCQIIQIPHSIEQDFTAFMGGLQSGSYAPDEGQPGFEEFQQAAWQIFERLGDGKTITLQVVTEIHCGKLF